MNNAKRKVKRRLIYRRGPLSRGRWVRFERNKDMQLVKLSHELGIEVAEVVRVAVDNLIECKELKKLIMHNESAL